LGLFLQTTITMTGMGITTDITAMDITAMTGGFISPATDTTGVVITMEEAVTAEAEAVSPQPAAAVPHAPPQASGQAEVPLRGLRPAPAVCLRKPGAVVPALHALPQVSHQAEVAVPALRAAPAYLLEPAAVVLPALHVPPEVLH